MTGTTERSPSTEPQTDWYVQRIDPGPARTRLVQATRRLAETQMRAELTDELADRVAGTLDELCDLLAPDVPEESPGARFAHGGPLRNDWGNAVVGLRNPVALPVGVERHPMGRARATFEVGCLFEGAPRQLHGGFCAMVLDQVVCEAAAAAGRAGVTLYLHVTYHRVAPMGRLHVSATVDRVEGRKSFVTGHVTDDDGNVLVSAEALIVVPRPPAP